MFVKGCETMSEQLGFSVSNFVELPIIPYGMKAVQKRDAKGRFISDWDVVPDPDAKPFPTEVGRVYLIDDMKYDEETRLFYVNAPEPKVVYAPISDEIVGTRKVCEYIAISDAYAQAGLPELDEHEWVPINPQPFCASCKEYEKYDNGEQLCMELGCRVTSTFYCKWWEMRA
jgi:hypothetical protein